MTGEQNEAEVQPKKKNRPLCRKNAPAVSA